MAKWVIYGKLHFYVQGILLPKAILDEAQKITYAFIRDKQKGISWCQMATRHENGCSGLKDIRTMAIVATIKHTIIIWLLENSLWVVWMCRLYVKGKNLDEINHSHSQLPIWASMLRTTSIIDKCISYNPEYNMIGKRKDMAPTAGNIYESICLPLDHDSLEEGIWMYQASKMIVTLWHLYTLELIAYL